jgi:glycosyltransferase involved in cell wall biosynthesis
MAGADLFVLPSEREGLPIALLEAMALGRPVVASAVGGIPDVITHGKDGLLVTPHDARSLADAMVVLLNNEVIRRRLGDEALTRSLQFDIGNAIDRMENVYRELV